MEDLKHMKANKYVYSDNVKYFCFIPLETVLITSAISLKKFSQLPDTVVICSWVHHQMFVLQLSFRKPDTAEKRPLFVQSLTQINLFFF